MKTLRLTKLESIAYTNDERRFWRACGSGNDGGAMPPPLSPEQQAALTERCPYGKSGDRIELTMRDCPGAVHNTIAAITVEQRGFTKRWGWVVEVWA